MNFQLISLNCRYSHSCLALFYLRNELEKHLPGCQAGICQFTINDPYYDTLLTISGTDAKALFFSVYIWNAAYTRRLIHDLATIDPVRPIILGGPQASVFLDLPDCCTQVAGPAEGLPVSFYTDLAGGSLQPRYQAVASRNFPSPYRPEDFIGPLRHRNIYYESARGCPFSCSYCLSSATTGVIYKELDTVRQELATILTARPKLVKFVDRTFNADPERAMAIWRFLIERQSSTMFHFEIAPDRFTEAMFQLLATVPPDLFQFEIGIQSTNPETLEAVNRRMTVEPALANITRLSQMNTIHLHVDLILGLPHDNNKNFQDSFNRVFGTAPHYIQMGLLKVLPDTPIQSAAAEFGLLYCGEPPHEIMANRWLDHAGLSHLHAFGHCVEAFYNNRYFTPLWRHLRDRQEDPFGFFSKLLTACRQHDFFTLAPTQELMNRILVSLVSGRPDSSVLLDLLRIAWLQCGHRYLPNELESTPLAATRDELRRQLPENLAGFYTHQTRPEFFKQGTFLRLPAESLRAAGLAEGDTACILAFLPERQSNDRKKTWLALIPRPTA